MLDLRHIKHTQDIIDNTRVEPNQHLYFTNKTHSFDIFLYNKKAIYKRTNQNKAAQNDYE